MRLMWILFAVLISGCQTSGSKLQEINRFAAQSAGPHSQVPLVVRVRPRQAIVNQLGTKNAIKESTRTTSVSIAALPNVTDIRPIEGTSLITLRAPAAVAADILKLPDVIDVFPDYPLEPFLNDAVPMTGLNNYNTPDWMGAGATTVILDDGVRLDHPFLQPRIVGQGCITKDNSCPNGQRTDFGPGSGGPCTAAGCWHGTHVAGIVAGLGAIGANPARGAAPTSNIISFRVQDADGVHGSFSSMREALQVVRDQFMVSNYVTAINISIGSDPSDSSTICGDPTSGAYSELTEVVRELRRQGVAVVAASGNDGVKTQVSYPACVAEVIAVGNTLKDNPPNPPAVSAKSNAGLALDVLAPGTEINSSKVNPLYGAATGTSMAAPLVAGGITALRGGADWSVDEIETALKQTGLSIMDAGRSYPRVNFAAARTMLSNNRPANAFVYIKDTPGDLGDQPDPRSANRPLHESPDVWVRNSNDGARFPYQHQNPIAQRPNFINAQVRNRGNQSASGFIVAYFVPAGNAAQNSSSWVQIGRSSTQAVPGGGSTIYTVGWSPPVSAGHYCILVKWFPAGTTPILSFSDMPTAVSLDRALVWRNMNIVNPTRQSDRDFEAQFGFPAGQATNIVFDFDGSPDGGKWYIEVTLPDSVEMKTYDATVERYATIPSDKPRVIRIPIEHGAVYLRDLVSISQNDTVLPIKLVIRPLEDRARNMAKSVTMRIIQINDVDRHKQRGFETGAGVTYQLKF